MMPLINRIASLNYLYTANSILMTSDKQFVHFAFDFVQILSCAGSAFVAYVKEFKSPTKSPRVG